MRWFCMIAAVTLLERKKRTQRAWKYQHRMCLVRQSMLCASYGLYPTLRELRRDWILRQAGCWPRLTSTQSSSLSKEPTKIKYGDKLRFLHTLYSVLDGFWKFRNVRNWHILGANPSSLPVNETSRTSDPSMLGKIHPESASGVGAETGDQNLEKGEKSEEPRIDESIT